MVFRAVYLLDATWPPPADRESLAAMLFGLLENVAGPGRSRLLAIAELWCEAARKPWLAEMLDEVAAADFAGFEDAQRAAGLPVTLARAAAVTLASTPPSRTCWQGAPAP